MHQFVLIFVFTMAAAAVVNAHVCMLSPPQRGSMASINKPGATDCNLETGPCGGRGPVGSSLGIKAGSKFLVAFQKNLDHFTASSPGAFNISLSFDGEKTFKLVQLVPDTSDPSLTLYYKNVTMPMDPVNQKGTLRVTYVTMNAQAPAAFYQCSDIMLYE